MAGRILVIRGGAIGDFILTLPAIKLIRDNFPEAEVEILGYRHIISIAEGRFYATRTRSIEYGPLSGFFIPNAELAPDLVEYFAGFQQVISYLYDPDRFFENNVRRCGVKNYIAGPGKLDDSEHAAYQLARPLQRLALYLEEPGARLFPCEEDRRFARQFLGASDRPIVAIHPGSGSAKKNWPAQSWRELIERVLQWPSRPQLLVIAGEADSGQLEALALPANKEILFARDLPLFHLAAILQQCRLFAGHDSGISHLAAGVGVPSLLLFGPTDPEIWAPANPQVRIARGPDGALAELDAETVEQRLAELLQSTS